MSRFTRPAFPALALLAAAATAPAAPVPAQATLLSAVPASAPVVAHLRGVEGARERFMALVKKALPELAPQVESFLDRGLAKGEFADGRKLRGVPKDGPIFLAF